MRCLVCDNEIRIDTLKQLFSVQPLILCSRCSENLIPKSADILFEDNEWLRGVVDKLNQGDLALIQLFENHLQRALVKKGALHSQIKTIEMKEDSPYPWLEILVDNIAKEKRKGTSSSKSNDEFIIAVEPKESVDLQISLLG